MNASGWAVFLDRDGTVNHHVLHDGRRSSPRSPAELVLVDGAAAAGKRLRAAGACLLVITNQPDLSRGLLQRDQLARLDDELRKLLGVSGIYTCPHTSLDRCDCRKPASGLLRRAAADHGIRLGASYLVGDRATDAQAAVNAGVNAVLLGTRTSTNVHPNVWYAAGLSAAASLIVDDRKRSARAEAAVHG